MVARQGCRDSDPDLSLSLNSDRLYRDALKIGSPWLIESHQARSRHRAVALAGGSPCGFRDRTGAPGAGAVSLATRLHVEHVERNTNAIGGRHGEISRSGVCDLLSGTPRETYAVMGAKSAPRLVTRER